MTTQLPDSIALDWNSLKHVMKHEVTESYVRFRMAATLEESVTEDLSNTIEGLTRLASEASGLAEKLIAVQIALEVSNV